MSSSLLTLPEHRRAAAARSGDFGEGRAADCGARLGRARGGAPGSRSASGHLIPEGEEEVTDVRSHRVTRVTVNRILMELLNNVEFAG